jgi:hypothetical protein
MYSSYKIFKEHRLIIEAHSGALDLQTMKKFTDIQVKDPDYDPNYNVIVDIRDAEVEFSLNEIKEFVSFIQEHDSTFGIRKDAILTSTSKQVAMASLYAEMQYLIKARTMVFSTINSISDWLSIENLEAFEIEAILENLKKDYFQV